MTDFPSLHGTGAMLLAVAMFYAFANGRLRVEIISLLTICAIAIGLYFFPLPGTVPSDGLMLAFEGFGHHALITICALMVLGRGLVVTGALDPAARLLSRVWRLNTQLGLLVTLIIAMFFSMLINDTPVLVLLLPILVQLANGPGMPASKTLMPVNAAILVGGMATTIGTSTNLLVVSIATDMGLPHMSVFHYTEIVLVAALVALPYIWLVMPRMLPDNSSAIATEQRTFLAMVRIDDATALHGSTAAEIRQKLPEGVTMLNDFSGGLTTGARIGISGTNAGLQDAARMLGGALAPAWLVAALRQRAQIDGEDLSISEVIVAPDSRLIGRSLQSSGLDDIAVIGVHQTQRPFRDERRGTVDEALREGDVLLVLSTRNQAEEAARREGLLILEGGIELPRSGKATLALAIMAIAVGAASSGLVPIAISALAGAVAMFLTGCVKFERVGRALSAQVIVLIAASIALGKLMLVSGAADWLGQLLASGLQFLPAAAVLASIMLFVTLLTNFASNATAAAVGTPIAFSIAGTLNLPPEPLVLAVLFGCNLCYATPVAYQTNMMIMSEGEYQFRDYMRTGVPLVLIMVVALSTLLVLRYGL